MKYVLCLLTLLLGAPAFGGAPWSTLDGSLGNGISGISPQFPTLLNAYHPTGWTNARYKAPPQYPTTGGVGNVNYQPPWAVAGVDYPVGINFNATPNSGCSAVPCSVSNGTSGASTAFTTYMNAACSGACSWSFNFATGGSGTVIVSCGGLGLTVSGWDFSVDGGYTFIPNNCNGVTLTNNHFFSGLGATATGMVLPSNPNSLQNVTIKNNWFSGPTGGLGGSAAFTCGNASLVDCGSIVFQYNFIQNTVQQTISIAAGYNLDQRFNLIVDICTGNHAGHANYLISSGGASSPVTQTKRVEFNTFVEEVVICGGNMSQFNTNDGTNQGYVKDGMYRYNTFLALVTNSSAIPYVNSATLPIGTAIIGSTLPGANGSTAPYAFTEGSSSCTLSAGVPNYAGWGSGGQASQTDGTCTLWSGTHSVSVAIQGSGDAGHFLCAPIANAYPFTGGTGNPSIAPCDAPLIDGGQINMNYFYGAGTGGGAQPNPIATPSIYYNGNGLTALQCSVHAWDVSGNVSMYNGQILNPPTNCPNAQQ